MSTTSPTLDVCLTNTVNIAHISDPHLPPPRIPYNSFLMNKRVLSLLLWITSRKHHHLFAITQKIISHIKKHHDISTVLVSGDLTNFGTYEEYLSSSSWLRSLPFRPLVVPGNHDIMRPIARAKSLDMWATWSGENYPFVHLDKHVAIIGLNSAFPTPVFTAYGKVPPQQLSHLDKILEELGQKGYCRVIMIHHPPKEGLVKKNKSLLNTVELSNILQKRGAELVLHGHSHNSTITTVAHTDIPLVGISSASMQHSSPRKKAAWNHLSFSLHNQKHRIELTRYDDDHHIISKKAWIRSLSE